MMRMMTRVMLLVVICLPVLFGNCIMDEKTIQIVVKGNGCLDFDEDRDSAVYSSTGYLNIANEIDDFLEDNEISRSDIVAARIISASYEITEFSHTNDWKITGSINVDRVDVSDGPSTVINYTSQDISAAVVGVEIPADLNRAGVELVNRSLADYIKGMDPILEFTVNNGDVDPLPSTSNHLVFSWKACLKIYVIGELKFDVPDPF